MYLGATFGRPKDPWAASGRLKVAFSYIITTSRNMCCHRAAGTSDLYYTLYRPKAAQDTWVPLRPLKLDFPDKKDLVFPKGQHCHRRGTHFPNSWLESDASTEDSILPVPYWTILHLVLALHVNISYVEFVYKIYLPTGDSYTCSGSLALKYVKPEN